MLPLFQRLNLRDQKRLAILNAPASFARELEALQGRAVCHELTSIQGKIDFVLVFVTTPAEIKALAVAIAAKAPGDAVIWFAYPKASSKKYQSEIKRDKGWQVMGDLGFEGVRAVAIDEDWSALRFRRVEYIKVMARGAKGALSTPGKARLNKD